MFTFKQGHQFIILVSGVFFCFLFFACFLFGNIDVFQITEYRRREWKETPIIEEKEDKELST